MLRSEKNNAEQNALGFQKKKYNQIYNDPLKWQWRIEGRSPGGLSPTLFFEVPELSSQNSTFIVKRAPSLAEGLDPPLNGRYSRQREEPGSLNSAILWMFLISKRDHGIIVKYQPMCLYLGELIATGRGRVIFRAGEGFFSEFYGIFHKRFC